MKHRIFIAILLILGFASLYGFKASSKATSRRGPASFAQPHLKQGYGNLPLAFEPNRGQTDPQVKFLARGSGYNLYITAQEAVLSLKKSVAFPQKPPAKGSRHKGSPFPKPDTTPPTVLRLQLEGAQESVSFESQEPLPGVSNYFIGNDRSKWLKKVPHYSKVAAHGLYSGVDMLYYGNQGKLEYDFVVQPGTDPGTIHLKMVGAQSVQVNGQGDMELATKQGMIVLRAPSVYQETGGIKNAVEGRYKLEEGNKVSFEVKDYDHTQPLVIDPVLDYSTYLGGSGADEGNAITVDPSGNAFITGLTQSSDFPVQDNPLGFGGQQNAFLSVLDPTGEILLFSTYFGGTGVDSGQGIALDSSENVYLTGNTTSTDFPVANPYQAFGNQENAFVSVIGGGGADLLFSTYIGGQTGAGADSGQRIALDPSGNIYVTGWTASTDFPTGPSVNTPIQASLAGNYNAFALEIQPGGSEPYVYSTFLGGNSGDVAYGIAADASGDAYVAGYTSSTNFPTTAGAYQSALAGGQNAFVTKIGPAGASLAYSTYLGGNGYDQCNAVAVDGSGDAYVVGITNSSNFPLQNPYQASLLATGGNPNAFVTQVNPSGNALVYSTYLGGNGAEGDYGEGIAVDSSGYAYVTGFTSSSNFPVLNAIQGSLAAGVVYGNAFVTSFDTGGTSLLYSTYLGGNNEDFGNAIAVDGVGDAYITGFSNSTNFPTTSGAYQSTMNGAANAIIFEITQALPTATSTSTPTVTFTSTATSTGTFTPTVTATATLTLTPGDTSTQTFTSTGTYTSTTTSSPTPTATATNSFTVTQTNTPPPTNTITLTPTRTTTGTPTASVTPLPPLVPVIGPPYPNPITGSGPVHFNVQASNNSNVIWSVFTTAFRKIVSNNFSLTGKTTVQWDLKDNFGNPVADGLYYLRVDVHGQAYSTQIFKILVLR